MKTLYDYWEIGYDVIGDEIIPLDQSKTKIFREWNDSEIFEEDGKMFFEDYYSKTEVRRFFIGKI